VLITTIPKSGSKLLKRILHQAGVDVSAMSHTPWSERALAEGERALCPIRDPRDLAVSLAHFAPRAGQGTRAMAEIARSGRELQNLIYFGVVARYVRDFSGWVADPACLTVRFEDIVGPRGGGSVEARTAAADRLADWLGVGRDRMRAAMEADTDTTTFRRGVIGAWRDEMEPELAEMIVQLSGDHMRAWGYL
jgi:hypothetical protein